MGQPIAKEDDKVVGVDTHIVMIPSPGGPVPTAIPMPFVGKLSQELATSAFVDGKAVAVKGSVAENEPKHIPTGGPFQKQPADRGTIETASSSVFVDGKEVARAADTVKTCCDPADAPNGVIIAVATVFAG